MDMHDLKAYAERLVEIDRIMATEVGRSTYKPEHIPSPLKLKSGRSGNIRVRVSKIRPGDVHPVVGLRQAVMRGCVPVNVRFERGGRFHGLEEQTKSGWQLWMTDKPEELNQIHEMIHDVKPFGSVLIGGLGLGLAASIVSGLPTVQHTTVVERNRHVVKLCANRELYDVVVSDISTFLKTDTTGFDCYLLDTWAGTGEMAWWHDVMPLKRLIRNRFGSKPVIHCWAEDIMQPQVMRAVTNPAGHWKHRKLPAMTVPESLKFVREVGLPEWEHRYGRFITEE